MSDCKSCHDYCEFGKKCKVPYGEYFDPDNCRENYEMLREWAEKKNEEED